MDSRRSSADSGRPAPLGATWDGDGVHFAIYSEHATAVDLCLLSLTGNLEQRRIAMRPNGEGVWHAYVRGLLPGAHYGYRVDGPYDPASGHRFNSHKLLIDPYARAIGGALSWRPAHAGAVAGNDALADPIDSATAVAPSVVVDPWFDWGDDRPPRTPMSRTVIYECHVKGMTERHPDVAPELRGTYLGLASPAVIEHLTSLGVTAVELLPVHHAYAEKHLIERGLTNYWGYAPIGYFAPDSRLATSSCGAQVAEFKQMVRRLHEAGIEVILDVVYNHTGEGDARGATVCMRGIDNAVYYRLADERASTYVDFTGCGNTLNIDHPAVLRLVLDSLRYWVDEMHVDGFRFDLAATLTRDRGQPVPDGRFVSAILQDPSISTVKLIMEPWDLGPGGHLEGAFPRGIAEWNARYRDCIRRYWRGDGGMIGELATRLGGSSDLFVGSRRGPSASVNFVACHDGPTLRDLVTYQGKYNQANGEQNRDGFDHGYVANWGHEGPTEDAAVRALRMRVMRSMLATLAFSQGVPMLQHGDELGRTQRGNNNAYCQDNELTWMDWTPDEETRGLLAWTRHVLRLRHCHPVLQRRTFFSGGPTARAGDGQAAARDLVWLRPDGHEMSFEDWQRDDLRSVAMLMHADGHDSTDDDPRRAETLLVILNAGDEPTSVRLPERTLLGEQFASGCWVLLADSAAPDRVDLPISDCEVDAHSLLLLAWRGVVA